MSTLLLEQVRKTYRKTVALEDITLEVQRGELFGLVGVNGAGKTTTLSLLMGFVQASSGQVRVLGEDPWNNPGLQRRLSWLPGEVRLPDAQTGRQWLSYQAQAAGHGLERLPTLEREWEAVLDRPLRTLSKGNRQKVALLRLLSGDAEVLILDEPTSGLDPVAQERLHETLRKLAQAGHTVLFSSHSLAEVQALCDRVAVLDRGKVLQVGRTSDLERRQERTLKVWTRDPVPLELLTVLGGEAESARHAVLRGNHLLEDALPRLFPYGIEQVQYGGEGLEGLLAHLHDVPLEPSVLRGGHA